MEITRLPSIDEADSEKALKELRSYIIRLDRQLSLLLDNVGEDNLSPSLKQKIYTDTESGINALKNEIIETATYIKELGDKIELKLVNEYVAKSEIGEYTEDALHRITLDGKGIVQYFEEVSTLSERLDAAEGGIVEGKEASGTNATEISRINAYIRTGKLADGVYGIEIGNFTGGENAPYKVRLSENRLSFFVGSEEAAYFSDNSMYISRANVPTTLKVGGCMLKNENGLSITAE